MKIIVPMAGMGKRMRPHTLTIPKPLLPIAGKPIVQRLVEDITKIANEKVEEIAYIIGESFGEETEKNLKDIAASLGAKGTIYYQDEALGTAHAILCATPSLNGKVIVAFADTLFKADFVLESEKDGIIWVQKIEDPRAFGVVKVDANNVITDFIEKPEVFVSDLAIIGIYYFKDGAYLRNELQYLIDNNIKEKGEYQLTNALENMKKKGTKFSPGAVTEWLDCGNKDATVYTNKRILEFNKNENLISDKAEIIDSVILQPCYIGDNVKISGSVIGPYASISKESVIKDSIIKNSIIQASAKIKNSHLDNSMVGNNVELNGTSHQVSIGDFTTVNN